MADKDWPVGVFSPAEREQLDAATEHLREDNAERDTPSPVEALALLVEACERGEKNLRPYLNMGHEAIANGSDDAEKYAAMAGRFQAAAGDLRRQLDACREANRRLTLRG